MEGGGKDLDMRPNCSMKPKTSQCPRKQKQRASRIEPAMGTSTRPVSDRGKSNPMRGAPDDRDAGEQGGSVT